ncbi:MAG TPA: hypothetical protein VFX17_03465 [Patescibacteria group bacterium]|nr:hypothetical protein [Patescibacteria group bacterium]
MFRDQLGNYILEADARLSALCNSGELKVTQEQFCNALKGYKLDEALVVLGEISMKLNDKNFLENEALKKERSGFIIHKLTKIFITEFALEYIANSFIISGANNYKSLSIKDRDNILALFNIYHNGLVQGVRVRNLSSFLVPMYFQQFTSQMDIKDVFIRQWLIFEKIPAELPSDLVLDLDKVLKDKYGISIDEYIKLSFAIFAAGMSSPRFNLGRFTESTITGGLSQVLKDEKMRSILNKLSVTPELFRDLDSKYNSNNLPSEYTKSRYNPLWEKPVIQVGANDYIIPSLSAYVKASFRGLYWIFENDLKAKFREYFGLLFERYVGLVLSDIYGESDVKPGFKYGSSHDKKEFFDWIVDRDDSVILIEAKGYQFPLPTLQTGDPALIRKEIFSKIIKTIKQMYDRVRDIPNYEELKSLKDKKIICIGIFYDVPLLSTSIYDEDIKKALTGLEENNPGIQDMEYYLISIEELEGYYFVKDYIEVDEIIKRVKANPATGVSNEISKVYKENNSGPPAIGNFLDRKFHEFYTEDLGLPTVDDE